MKCILLHGLGQNPSDWSNTIRYIDNRIETSCPALFEWLSEKDASYMDIYKGLENYCDQFEQPFILVGLSLGGILALQYALEHGNKVHSLILIGTQFSMPKNILHLQNMIFRFMPNKIFMKMGLNKTRVIQLCHSMINLDFTEKLKDISCKTVILCGKKDKSNQTASVKLKEQIKNAELLFIPNSGHEVNIDNPMQLGKVISKGYYE